MSIYCEILQGQREARWNVQDAAAGRGQGKRAGAGREGGARGEGVQQTACCTHLRIARATPEQEQSRSRDRLFCCTCCTELH